MFMMLKIVSYFYLCILGYGVPAMGWKLLKRALEDDKDQWEIDNNVRFPHRKIGTIWVRKLTIGVILLDYLIYIWIACCYFFFVLNINFIQGRGFPQEEKLSLLVWIILATFTGIVLIAMGYWEQRYNIPYKKYKLFFDFLY